MCRLKIIGRRFEGCFQTRVLVFRAWGQGSQRAMGRRKGRCHLLSSKGLGTACLVFNFRLELKNLEVCRDVSLVLSVA